MEKPIIDQIFEIVDEYRANETTLTTLDQPECIVFVGTSPDDNLLSEEMSNEVKGKISETVQDGQNRLWERLQEILNAGSPYQ